MTCKSNPRLVLFCVVAAIAPGPVVAQKPAPASPASTAAKPPEPIGRLFFTPAQRASLDVARTRNIRAPVADDESGETAESAAQSIVYRGMVRRSDGKSTLWINNRAVNETEAATGPVIGKVRPDGSLTLQLPQSGRSVDLKPGQSIELLSGTIEEAYSRKPGPLEPRPAAKAGTDSRPSAGPAPESRTADERDREDTPQKPEASAKAPQDARSRSGPAPTAPRQEPSR